MILSAMITDIKEIFNTETYMHTCIVMLCTCIQTNIIYIYMYDIIMSYKYQTHYIYPAMQWEAMQW